MLPATVSVPAAELPAARLAAYRRSLAAAGHGNTAFEQAARSFLRHWPNPQRWAEVPLPVRLRANASTLPFVTFLMLSGRLQPRYDYLVARKLSSLWRYVPGSPLGADLSGSPPRRWNLASPCGFRRRSGSRSSPGC